MSHWSIYHFGRGLACQDREVVITGDVDRETALALIEFGNEKRKLGPNFADTQEWTLSLIRPPEM